jgi:hypothetical protein
MVREMSQPSGQNPTARSGLERYAEHYWARIAAGGGDEIAPPDRRRMLALTAAFTPMIAVAALPVTAGIAVAAWLVGNVTARWIGLVLLVAAMVALGYLTARSAASYNGLPAVRGLRRWLPQTATVAVAGSGLAEIMSGSRAPDAVFVLWFASMVWLYAFLPLAVGAWGRARRALWTIGPTVALAAIIFVWTQGFFAIRFANAVPEFDELARQVADGDHVADGTPVGGFEVHNVNLGRLGTIAGCDLEFWITGWHQNDTRYIVHCAHPPKSDFTHLTGQWWQIKGRTIPSDL